MLNRLYLLFYSVSSFSMPCSSSSFSIHTIATVCVDHKDQAMCVLVVVAPQRTNLVLSTDVLHREANVLVLHRHDIKSYHRLRATDTKQRDKNPSDIATESNTPDQALLPVYISVPLLSISLYIPTVGTYVTTSTILSLSNMVV